MNTSKILRCRWLTAVGLLVLLGRWPGSAAGGESKGEGPQPPAFRTTLVTRGDLLVTISATGTLEPEEVVDVGAQVAGRIERLGPDPRGKTDPRYRDKSIDFCSPVDEGSVLAQIDPAVYAAQVDAARAGCRRVEAEAAQVRARLELAEAQWRRAQEAAKAKVMSTAEFDAAKAECEAARASLAVAEASLAQSKAALSLADLNLGYTTIRSPIKGVIIDRRVNVGQTVVASLNAPSLFLIAKDLKKMQVWAAVNEADISQIRAGEPAQFTVDAFPGNVFQGKVEQVRLNAQMTKNVVTYTVVVTTDNPGGKLLPYLTANVRFEVDRRKEVLLVPNAALRWRPLPQWIAPDAGEKTSPGQKRGRLWVRDGKFVRPIDVQVGPSDGRLTEVGGSEVKEGLEVVVGGDVAAAQSGQTSKTALQKALESMGTNTLLVLPGAPSSGGVTFGSGAESTLTPQDAEEIARQCPAVGGVAPIVRARSQVVYGDRNWVPMSVQGTTPDFLAVRDWDIDAGRVFFERDVRNAAKVCVLGQTVARELLQDRSPVGEEVRIQGVSFRVVGVLSRKGANVMGMDQDDIVLAPWTTIKHCLSGGTPTGASKAAGARDSSDNIKTLGDVYPGSQPLYAPPSAPQAADARQPVRLATVDQILVKAASTKEIPQAIEQIQELLRKRHRIGPGQSDDFSIRDMTALSKAVIPPGAR
jgi:HlyD family secretion protein